LGRAAPFVAALSVFIFYLDYKAAAAGKLVARWQLLLLDSLPTDLPNRTCGLRIEVESGKEVAFWQ